MTTTRSVEETMVHSKREKNVKNKGKKFSQQQIHLSDIAFLPEGYEAIFLGLYVIILPYLAGLIFQFFYVCSMKVEVFLTIVGNTMFMLIWAIGYEIIAFIILTYIAYMAIKFTKNDIKHNKDTFRIP